MSEDVYNAAYLTVSGFAYLIFLLRLVRSRGGAAAPVATVSTVSLLAGATAFLFGSPLVYRAVGEATGVPNLATLFVYGFVTLYGGLAQGMALRWAPVERPDGGGTRSAARRHIAAYLALIAVLAALFAWGAPAGPAVPLTFDVEYADQPVIFAFLMLYQAGWFYACLHIAAICRRHLRRVRPDERTLRRSLRLVLAGVLTCSTYGVCKTIAITGIVLDAYRVDVLSNVVGPATSALGAALISLGFLYPLVRKWHSARRDYLHLAPLWNAAMQERTPSRSLVPVDLVFGRLALSGVDYLLARRIIEITDAQRALQPYAVPGPAREVTGSAERHRLAGDDLRAAQDAATFLGALRRVRAGQAPGPRPVPEGPGRLATDLDARAERAHLVRIARHLRHPAVLEAVRRAR
ncbi:MAB_1171c family putative transporter [Streptomyces sp. TRM 70361]|uniref:MAB_1171c family putative transporter n=1 Tax=Streptomyces sp. TRM 70361 TaxID=3116553 RepID=UPI002E7AD492|nr:MAB_1171c family putative transporter [Streptomyces sp. TRM 70361]MEE1938092.1 MAB_1171c family putative transporter [Streptomyces sp. TRM 70361]